MSHGTLGLLALEVGDRLAERYRITRNLGRGGMASVFLVEDERARLPRVLKQLRLDEPALLQAFRQEFALLARITHPNLVRVHDLGTWRVRGELYHYYTADWVDAETLALWTRRGGGDCSKPALDALAGLSALHATGVRHGDVSPDNVLVQSDGSGLLIDLGCARPFAWRATSVAGTPGFIAPELLQGKPGDARSDLYSLGQTLRWAHEASRLPLTGKLRALCDRLCASDPDARPGSAREALAALGRRVANSSTLQVAARELVGREAELSEFQTWLEKLIARQDAPRIYWMYGESGVGTSRLLREFVALSELQTSVLRARGDELSPVPWLLTTALGEHAAGLGVRDVLRAAHDLSEREEPQLLVLEDAHRLEPEELELLLAFLRSLPQTSRVGCLVSSRTDANSLSAVRRQLRPLGLDALRRWTHDSLSRGALDELHRQSQGLPAQVEALLVARSRTPEAGAAREDPAPRDLEELLATSTASGRRALATLIALGGETEMRAPGLDAEELAPFLEAGWLRRDGARFRVSVRGDVARIERALGPELDAVHRVLAEWFASSASGLSAELAAAELVYHAASSGDRERAEATFQATEPYWREHPRLFARRLLPLAARAASSGWLLLWAEVSLLAGEFQQTLRAAARLLRSRPNPDVEARTRLLAADALLRLGRGPRAERLLDRLQGDQVGFRSARERRLCLPGCASHSGCLDDARSARALGARRFLFGARHGRADHFLRTARRTPRRRFASRSLAIARDARNRTFSRRSGCERHRRLPRGARALGPSRAR